MNYKTFFRQIRREQIELARLHELIQFRQWSLLPSAIRYDKERVQGTPEDLMLKGIAEVDLLKEALKESLSKLIERKVVAWKLIDKLPDPEEREVMRLYYLTTNNGKLLSWDDVANVMGYSERKIFILHGAALKSIEKLGLKIVQ